MSHHRADAPLIPAGKLHAPTFSLLGGHLRCRQAAPATPIHMGSPLTALSRYGPTAKAPAMRELAEPRRTATLLATARC